MADGDTSADGLENAAAVDVEPSSLSGAAAGSDDESTASGALLRCTLSVCALLCGALSTGSTALIAVTGAAGSSALGVTSVIWARGLRRITVASLGAGREMGRGPIGMCVAAAADSGAGAR